jgi:deoxyribonuclease IV
MVAQPTEMTPARKRPAKKAVKKAAKKTTKKTAVTKAAKKAATKTPAKKKGASKPPAAKRKLAAELPAQPKPSSRKPPSTRPRGSIAPKGVLPEPIPVDTLPDDLLGAHVSSAGGSFEAPPRAAAIGATALQLFTKQANRWAEREIDTDEAAQYRAALVPTGVKCSGSHDSYLINLASPDPTLRATSLQSFRAELRRCHALGLDVLVSHPGNYMDDRASGLARNADAISEALTQERGPTRLLLELTAGQGTVLGSTFEEMAALIASIDPSVRTRIGVCLDTAHVFAAGYAIGDDYDGVWARFEDTIGRDRLGMLHLNDSKAPFGSKKDRHELIGEGAIGAGAFRRIMTDPRLSRVPKVIETPKGDDPIATDRLMLERLRGYAAGR